MRQVFLAAGSHPVAADCCGRGWRPPTFAASVGRSARPSRGWSPSLAALAPCGWLARCATRA